MTRPAARQSREGTPRRRRKARSPGRPDHFADWEDKETICRVVDHYAGGLSFSDVWTAREGQVVRFRGYPTLDQAVEAVSV